MSTRFAIIGGGASGTFVAAALERAAERDERIDITLIERDGRTGPGLAYGAAESYHVLNSPAGKASAVTDDPNHFVDWAVARGHDCEPTTFMPREVYGAYLCELVAGLGASPHVTVTQVHAEAREILSDELGVRVVLDDGRCIETDNVVLAVGNPPPYEQPISDRVISGDGYIANPWDRERLLRIGRGQRVLILGTGLTMVDVAMTLHRMHPELPLVAASRAALLPHAHSATPLVPGPGIPESITDLDDVVAEFLRQMEEAERAGGDWRSVVDGMRPQVARIWKGFDGADQERFLAEFSREWEVRRHRMAPQVHAEVEAMQASGHLTLRPLAEVDIDAFDVVINCTGARSVSARGWNPVVDGLLDSGLVRPDRHDLGLDLTPVGQCIGDDGEVNEWLYAVGPASKGTRWECGAIPEIRADADAVAASRVHVSA
ncbi:FAD/NAD(P)-binding protein [soil metagenome]